MVNTFACGLVGLGHFVQEPKTCFYISRAMAATRELVNQGGVEEGNGEAERVGENSTIAQTTKVRVVINTKKVRRVDRYTTPEWRKRKRT